MSITASGLIMLNNIVDDVIPDLITAGAAYFLYRGLDVFSFGTVSICFSLQFCQFLPHLIFSLI
jgi:hypothetical protein